MRNLELVQPHRLFTFMGRLTDGPGSILQQSLAGGRKASVSRRSFSSCGSLDGLGSAATCARTHLCSAHRGIREGGGEKNVDPCMFSLPNHSLMLDPLRRHYQRRRGQPGGFKVTSQSTGVRAPSVNRRQELARCGAHRECYLLVIVVVILCPVWQRINEQHANTFCPNICDRHIFRPASKKLGKKREKKMEAQEVKSLKLLDIFFLPLAQILLAYSFICIFLSPYLPNGSNFFFI